MENYYNKIYGNSGVADKRYLKYFYDFTDAKGNRHCGINVYDNVLKWVTFVNDYKFDVEKSEKSYQTV